MRAVALIAAGVALAGCASSGETLSAAAPLQTEQFKAQVKAGPQQVLLAPHGAGLSDAQRSAMYQAVTQWRNAYAGVVVVETPSAADADTLKATGHVDQFLRTYGVTGAEVQFRRYEASDPKAPIKVTFPIYTVDIPKCGQDWGDLARSSDNQPMANFGCATSANIAAMVVNPSDLNHPQGMTAPDASRRQVVLDKYRQGQTTSSAADAQSSAAISDAIR